jgi:uncharacterized protein YgfB (UPF0149 family)
LESNIVSEMPDFRRLDKQLAMFDADVGTAEAHGLLVAILLGSHDNKLEKWLLELVPLASDTDVLLQETVSQMKSLFNMTEKQLADDGSGFSLFLPEDQGQRRLAEAIVEWCTGFLYGLGVSGLKNRDLMAVDCQEAIDDIGKITQLEISSVEGESDEESVMQLEEFVSVAVLLIRENLPQK